MPYAALRTSLLAARDERQALLDSLFPAGAPTTLMLSLNLPGTRKTGAPARRLFDWGERALLAALPALPLLRGSDQLGPFGIYRSEGDPREAKRRAIGVESGQPAGRLLDIDIYDASGRQVDRSGLGLPPRGCLVCPEPALSCMRAGRHDSDALMARAQELIDAL